MNALDASLNTLDASLNILDASVKTLDTSIKNDEFVNKINDGGFLEYSNHFENYYGTPKDFVLINLSITTCCLK
jgi:hypothetical protein